MKWLRRYPLSTWLLATATLLKPRAALISFWLLIGAALYVGIANLAKPPPPLTPERQAQLLAIQQRTEYEAEQKRAYEAEVREQKARLCRWAARCRQYDAARLQCATAGNFNMCMKINMGSEADYIGACSGFKEGTPAIAPSPETPNLIELANLVVELGRQRVR